MHIHRAPHIRRSLLSPRRAILSLPLIAVLGACDDPAGGSGSASQTCAAPVQLAVGESTDLAADADGRVRCRIRASGDAEFVVAFTDTRATRKALTENEGYGDAFSAYTVTAALDEDVAPAPPAPEPAARSARRAPDFDVQSAVPPYHGVLRETPWTLDERFELYDGGIQAPRTARVMRIYAGRYVYAWLEGENEPQLAPFLAQLDSAWAAVGAHAVPLLRGAYSDQDPRTSPGSGQYLTVLRAVGRGTAAGWTISLEDFGEPRIWTELKVIPQASAMRLGEIVAHELTHAFQAMYMYRTRPGGVGSVAAGAAFWGVEGGADLVAFETARRAAGLPLTANLDMGRAAGPALRVAAWGRNHGGRLTDGYADAAGFLRWQAALRVRAGDAEDVAVGEVLRGASDGWHGYDHLNARRTGLAERMRARLGDAWSPEDALLDWALAHAADDGTPDARWQDPTFLRVWSGGPWPPLAELPAPGGAASTTRPYGSPDYLRIHVTGDTPFAAVSSVPGVRWRILRVR